jgi:hypothetical protein
MININDLQATELEELDLVADSEDYLKKLSNEEENKVYGGGPGYTF